MLRDRVQSDRSDTPSLSVLDLGVRKKGNRVMKREVSVLGCVQRTCLYKCD